MDPNQGFLASFNGFADLWHCLFSNEYPAVFLKNVLGLSPEQAATLPRYLIGYAALYLLCGVVTAVLRFTRKQYSLHSRAKQLNNIILTMADFFFVPQLLVFIELGKASLGAVTPYAGELSDLVRFFSDAWTSVFTPLFLFLVVLATALLPFQAAIRYLRVYKLASLPHMVFDVGTGLYLLSAVLLSMCSGNRMWYLLIPISAALLCVVQTGGYIPEEQNAKTAAGTASVCDTDGSSEENKS